MKPSANKIAINTIVTLLSLSYVFSLNACALEQLINADDEFSTCKVGKSAQFGNYIITNNAWGIKKLKGDPQTSMLCTKSNALQENGSVMTAMWNLGDSPNAVIAYPMISYGVWGWSHPIPVMNLPKKISDLSEIVSKVNYKIKSKDSFDVAYDIWLSDREEPKLENIKVELMVWTDWQNAEPLGVKVGDIRLDDDVYDIYKAKVSIDTGNWTYIALVINHINKSTIVKSLHETINHEIQSSRSINIKSVLYHLVTKKIIDNDLYLNGISFGTEIMGGSGIFNVNLFQVQISKK